MRKWIHIPTLLLHCLLLLDAALAINHYSDFFLISSLGLLILYFVYCIKTPNKGTASLAICLSYGSGALIQFIVFRCDVIPVHSGAFGLGGGEFALLIYGAAMGISCIVVFLICSCKRYSK